MDGLRRLREPAAFAVLAVLLLQVLIEWVGFVAYGSARLRMPETLTILVLGLIVASCSFGERTAHARMLTVLAVCSVDRVPPAPGKKKKKTPPRKGHWSHRTSPSWF